MASEIIKEITGTLSFEGIFSDTVSVLIPNLGSIDDIDYLNISQEDVYLVINSLSVYYI